jgi:hypothetical protein
MRATKGKEKHERDDTKTEHGCFVAKESAANELPARDSL